MADILIRGMEMPTQCGNCPISTNTRRCTILWREFGDPSKRLEDCPLLPLTELDYTMLYKENWMRGTGVEAPAIWKSDIDAADTIVPAEGD